MPTISNVTGFGGPELSITGIDLIDEDTTGYDPDFNEAEFNCNGTSWIDDGYVNGANFVYDSVTKLIGDNAPKCESSYSDNPGGSHGVGAGTGRTTLSSTPGHHFISFYVRDDFSYGNGTWAGIAHKLFNNYGGSLQYNVNWNQNFGDAYTQLYVDLDGTGYYSSSASVGWSFTHKQNRWYHVEVEVPGASPWTFRVRVNGELAFEENFAGDPGLALADTEFVINNQSDDPDYGLRQWIDGIRASSQLIGLFSKYEVGDNSDYATANKVYQFPEYLADTIATINYDDTGLTGTDRFLWVTNHRGERSDAYNLNGANPDRSDPARMFRSLGRPRHSIFR